MNSAADAANESSGGDAPTVLPIANEDLTRDHLPHPRAPFEEVVHFAYTFDGYERFGMRMCGEMANRGLTQFLELGEVPPWLAGDLDRLRACVFFEARRWILLEREPDTRALIYVHGVIEAIGARIDARTDAAGGPR